MVSTGTEAFVRSLYLNMLGREPDPAGFRVQVDAIDNGLFTPDQIINNIARSAEIEQNTSAILRAYVGMLLRTPEPGSTGLDLQQHAMAAGIMDRASFVQAVETTPEFQGISSKYPVSDVGNSLFINAVYKSVFGVTPDVRATKPYLDQLNAGISRGTVVDALVNSTDGAAKFASAVLPFLVQDALDAVPSSRALNAIPGYGQDPLSLINQYLPQGSTINTDKMSHFVVGETGWVDPANPTAKNDTIVSTGGNVILAGSGDDQITAGPGDLVFCGTGNDRVTIAPGAYTMGSKDASKIVRIADFNGAEISTQNVDKLVIQGASPDPLGLSVFAGSYNLSDPRVLGTYGLGPNSTLGEIVEAYLTTAFALPGSPVFFGVREFDELTFYGSNNASVNGTTLIFFHPGAKGPYDPARDTILQLVGNSTIASGWDIAVGYWNFIA